MRRLRLEPEDVAPTARVKSIFVKRLLGRFDHEVRFNLEDRITIIHGPNGFGKTVLLRLIDGLFSGSNYALRSIPFCELQVEFDDGRSVTVIRTDKPKDMHSQRRRPDLRFIYRNGGKPHEHLLRDRHPEQLEFPLGMIDEVIPELDRVGPDTWRNNETGELLSVDEIVDRFEGRFHSPPREDDRPDWLAQVRRSIQVRFIQAERLQAVARPRRSRNLRHEKVQAGRAVKQYSEELGVLIKQTLTEYAALSQSLDRSFPARALAHSGALSNAALLSALKETELKRARLLEAGLLAQEGEETPFQPLQYVDQTNLPLLSVYVEDTRQKLSVFDNLMAKVELFKKSVNDRFLYKRISIGKEGFTFTTPEGDQLDPLSLSSGEQHEIILLYELLFQTSPNSLVLLDEPEISLHVAWQEQFLPDLRRITDLSKFDALIATHSPQIISDRWDLTVELHGPKEATLAHTGANSK